MKYTDKPDGRPSITKSDPALFASRLAKQIDLQTIEIEGKPYYGTIEGKVAWAYFLPGAVRKSIYSKMTAKEKKMDLLLTNPIILVPTSLVRENKRFLESNVLGGLANSSATICDKTIIFICPDDEQFGDGVVNLLFSRLPLNEQQDFFLSYLSGGDISDPDCISSMDKHVFIRSLIVTVGYKPLYDAMKRHPYLFSKWINEPVSLALKAFTLEAISHDERFYKEANSFFEDLLSKSFTGSASFFLYCYLVGGLHEIAFDSLELPYSPAVKKMARCIWNFEMGN